ncbi:hypothetical protein H8S95_00665 [Pontibacter sp. KCTC 32443]|uniref:hypothetical protein n=1 Tax=Pontibacter TaxID=323449 RepID=UPI00164DFFF9|nr:MULTISPECIES: hypothetical protein [Pontibacter]MBC5772561.1 hypothetical protein [Pontibacter sp. KCTC 32443]
MELPFHPESVTEEVLQNDFVSIINCQSDSCILIKWKRQIDFEERKEIFLWAYQFCKDNEVKNWLIDDEEIYIITSEERNWVANEWTEIVADSGIRKIAVYVPEYNYNALANQTDFTQTAQNNYQRHGTTEHEVFTDYQTAMHWIRS